MQCDLEFGLVGRIDVLADQHVAPGSSGRNPSDTQQRSSDLNADLLGDTRVGRCCRDDLPCRAEPLAQQVNKRGLLNVSPRESSADFGRTPHRDERERLIVSEVQANNLEDFATEQRGDFRRSVAEPK